MNPLLILVSVGILSFLGGIAATVSRKDLSMLPIPKKSPLKGILLVSWTRFVGTMARHPKKTSTSRGRYGMFGMDARRLADVGFICKPRKVILGNETGVWTGDWKAPLSKETYLDSTALQYVAFTKSMTAMVPKVEKFVGCDVGGSKCSLSGLLGVGHMAGEAGVESWVRDPKIRAKFKNTTETFVKTNGIF